MRLAHLASDFLESDRGVGVILPPEQVVAQAVAAARQYAAYGTLKAHRADPDAAPLPPSEWVNADTDVTPSEWGVIRPLFLLYVERENALLLESSRVMGVDVFGRSTSEVSAEIAQMEADMPKRAFYQPVITV